MTITNVKFEVEIDSCNASVVDNPHQEIINVLKVIIRGIHVGILDGKCRDLNGNQIGEWGLDIERDDDEEDNEEEE